MPAFGLMDTVVSMALESSLVRPLKASIAGPIKKVVRIAVGGIVKGAVKRAFLVGLPLAGATVGVIWWRKRQRSSAESGPPMGEANQAESPSPQDSSASPGPSRAKDGRASDETSPEPESGVKTPEGGDDASPERASRVKAPEGGDDASSKGVASGQAGAAGDPLTSSERLDSKGDPSAPRTGLAPSGGGESRTPAGGGESPSSAGGGESPSSSASAADVDDLTRVNGVGPKVAKVLGAAGITTYAHLAQMEVTDLRQLMREARISASVETWPAQAKLAAVGDWEGLQTFLRAR